MLVSNEVREVQTQKMFQFQNISSSDLLKEIEDGDAVIDSYIL
jgi:hypothetical protein